MIKSVSIEQKFFDRCILQKPPHFGLVVGGLNKEDECVFFLLKSKEAIDGITTVEDIDSTELSLQCRKIARMLPAGMHLSGLYFAGLNISNTQSTNCVKKLIKVVHESENSTQSEHYTTPENEKIFLQVEINTKKIIAKAINPMKVNDFFRPIDVKVRSVIDRWRAIKTYITLSVETHLPAERQRDKILEHLKLAVDPYLQTVNKDTRLLVNNIIRRSEDNIFAIRANNAHKMTGSKGKHSKRHTISKEATAVAAKNSEEGLTHHWENSEFTLFGPDFPCWQRTHSCSSIDSGHSSDALAGSFDGSNSSSLQSASVEAIKDTGTAPTSFSDKNLLIHGRIPGIAYLPIDGTSVSDALAAFRRDLVHSILMRLELLAEELHVTSGQIEVSRILLPQRVLIRVPVCPAIPLSDYKFISETPDDVVKRVAMFCQPLGSPISREVGDGDGEDVNRWSESGLDFLEPAFNASCLDTKLERNFEGSGEDEISDVEIIEEITEIAHTVSQSKGTILLVCSALCTLILGLILSVYLEILKV